MDNAHKNPDRRQNFREDGKKTFIPDQELFEPLPDEDLSHGTSTWKRIALGAFAVLAIVLLLNIFGFYQMNLLTETPRTTGAPEFSALIDEAEVTLPLSIMVVEGETGSGFDESDIYHIIENADRIWDQARVSFEITSISFLELGEREARTYLTPANIPSKLLPEQEGEIRVFLVNTLLGLNGIAFGEAEVAVSRYTSFRDYRTLAHEVGHILGLSHVDQSSHLMSSGGTGVILEKQEAERAYSVAKNLVKQQSGQ